MRVFINYMPHLAKLYKNNTDIKYTKNFLNLQKTKELGVLDFTINNDYLSNFLTIIPNILRSILSKLSIESEFIEKACVTVYLFPWQLKRVDVIFSHGIYPVQFVLKKKPVVVNSGFMTDQYVNFSDRQHEVTFFKKVIDKRCDIIVLSSKDAVQRLKTYFPEIHSKLRVSLTYILPFTKPISPELIVQKFQIPLKKILFVGRDGKRKGVFPLLNGIRLLSKQIKSNIFFIFISEEDIEKELLTLDVKYEYYQSLPYDVVQKKFETSHIFCLPTQKEALGLVFVEAMANGCAIIADGEYPRREMLNNGECGVLIDNIQSPSEIAAALTKLIENTDLSFSLAQRAYEKYVDSYSFEMINYQYIQFFREATGITSDK